ncbi:MAG TPA: hypothetical protein VNA14_00655 [Mycobacteriales bacterium]|nr:hypothetical protein [Mycobacteriales bacterium]
MAVEQILIERRFRGPDRSGNGGWTAGLVAEAHAGPAEVTLRMPPPLDRPLDVVSEDAVTTLWDGESVVAEARPAPSLVDLEPPRPVSYAEAEKATARFAGHDAHLFAGCFVCGPARGPGDGLRIFPGPVGDGLLAATWTPDDSLAVGDAVPLAAVWAALDCPGGWAGELSEARPAVLGRLTVDVRRACAVGEPLVVLGWPVEDLAKKFLSASALLDADGEVLAVARATWVRIDSSTWV